MSAFFVVVSSRIDRFSTFFVASKSRLIWRLKYREVVAIVGTLRDGLVPQTHLTGDCVRARVVSDRRRTLV